MFQPNALSQWPSTIERDFINSPWKWKTTAPEAHGAQVFPDPDLGSYKVTHPNKLGVPCNFCFLKFSPKCMAEAPEAPQAPF